MYEFDGTTNQGRKGVAYDWQSLYVASEASTIDHELTTLTQAYTSSDRA
jgi:hypothetical protein